jgi:hypothetical protein
MFVWVAFLATTLALKATSLPRTGAPPDNRQQNCLAYDQVQNLLVSFGGMNENIEFFDDIWVFNFTSSQWREITSTSSVIPGES